MIYHLGSLIKVLGIAIALVWGMGCSKDQSVLDTPSHHRNKPECNGVMLTNQDGKLTSPLLRSLISCLNSAKDLDPIEDLISELSDEELAPFLVIVNEGMLSNPDRMLELQLTVDAWEPHHIVDQYFEKTAPFLERPEWITYVIESIQWEAGLPKQWIEGIEVLARLFKSRNYRDLEFKVRNFKNQNPDFTLDQVAELFTRYQQDPLFEGEFKFTHEATWLFANGDLFKVLDQLFGKEPNQFLSQLQRYNGFLNFLFSNQSKWFDEFTRVMWETQGEIPCFGGAKNIKSGSRLGVEEIAKYVTPDQARDFYLRQIPLHLTALRSFCDVSPDFQKANDFIIKFGKQPYAPMSVEVLNAFNFSSPDALTFLTRLLTHRGKPQTQGGSGNARLWNLLPLLEGFEKSQIFSDLALMLMALDQKDRESIQYFFSFFSKRPKAYYEEQEGVLDAKQVNLTMLRQSFELLQNDGKSFTELFEVLRKGSYIGVGNPWLEVFSEIFKHDPKGTATLRSILKLIRSPKFAKASLWIKQSSEKRQLGRITSSLFRILKAAKNDGTLRVNEEVPPLRKGYRHTLSSYDLKPYLVQPNAEPIQKQLELCEKISWEFTLGGYRNPLFKEQARQFVVCFASDNTHPEMSDFLLNSIVGSSWNDPSFYQMVAPHAELLFNSMSLEVRAEWLNRVLRSVDDGRFDRVTRAAGMWIGSDPDSAPLKPLSVLLKGSHRWIVGIKDFEALVGEVLRSPAMPSSLKSLKRIDHLPPTEVVSSNGQTAQASQLEEWLKQGECLNTQSEIDRRSKETLDDVSRGYSNTGYVYGRAKKSWTKSDLKAHFQGILQKFSDPKNNNPQKSLSDALVNIVKYFSLQDGEKPSRGRHYTSAYLLKWLQDHAQDMRPVALMTNDSDIPQVRVVNQLDELELILAFANLEFIDGKNRALRFMELIGNAWGDEPREIWPLDIAQKYPHPKRPQTLREAYEEILDSLCSYERWGGYPDVKTCGKSVLPKFQCDKGYLGLFIPRGHQVRIFNIRQVVSVIERNLPGSDTQFDGGFKVLRDLFYELVTSSLPKYRGDGDGELNNLSLLPRLGDVGMLRQLSMAVFDLSEEKKPVVLELLELITTMAAQPETKAVFSTVLNRDGKHELFWAFFNQIFDLYLPSEVPLPKKYENFKDLLLYASALLNRTLQEEHYSAALKLVDLAANRYSLIFKNHPDYLKDLLESKETRDFFNKLYFELEPEEIQSFRPLIKVALGHPEGVVLPLEIRRVVDLYPHLAEAYTEFRNSVDQMKATSAYQNLKIEEISEEWVDFLISAEVPGYSQSVVLSLAELFSPAQSSSSDNGGVLSAAVQWQVHNPQNAYDALSGLSKGIEKGDMHRFMLMVRRFILPEFNRTLLDWDSK